MAPEGRLARPLPREVLAAVHAPRRPGHRVADDYGVWVERNRFGRKSMGIERSTFVIDEHGNVARALRRVKPEGHAERVLEALPG